ncbi:MAG: LysM peptidoglycan-binding domain-containing protein [Agathobacter sp.]|nr:LysM peptidoglycan-binding domain-containing protein [Agathobacter sp.]
MMERVYNDKISKKANESLAKRAHTVRAEKRILLIAGIILVSILILLGSSMNAFASSRTRNELHKYYTSIEVNPGDTLWNISEDYVIDHVMSREDFIDEVCRLNNISEKDILHSGQYLIVAYYSTEEK